MRAVVRLSDTRQCKPGTFEVHACGACGHRFQNPMLTAAGLDYYYRDFYDGDGAEHYATTAGYARGANRTRVRRVTRWVSPRTWLDLGARHGHLCHEARSLLPSTTFTALDAGTEIEAARLRGWVDEVVRVPLLDHRAGSRFDVVSMVHYLERCPTPDRELDAAVALLADGGVLLLESVNPDSVFARLYGRFWFGWMAPQHLHLMPWENVRLALQQRGLTILDVELGRANKPFDTMAALLTLLNHALPPARRWVWVAAEVPRRARWWRRAVMTASLPLIGLGLLLDLLLHPVTARGDGGNTYRIVAVRGAPRPVDS